MIIPETLIMSIILASIALIDKLLTMTNCYTKIHSILFKKRKQLEESLKDTTSITQSDMDNVSSIADEIENIYFDLKEGFEWGYQKSIKRAV